MVGSIRLVYRVDIVYGMYFWWGRQSKALGNILKITYRGLKRCMFSTLEIYWIYCYSRSIETTVQKQLPAWDIIHPHVAGIVHKWCYPLRVHTQMEKPIWVSYGRSTWQINTWCHKWLSATRAVIFELTLVPALLIICYAKTIDVNMCVCEFPNIPSNIGCP